MRLGGQAKSAALLLCLVLATLTGCSESGGTGASLQPTGVSGASTVVLGGGTVTLGFQVLTLAKGSSPVRITAVHLVSATGMTLVGARLAGPKRPVYQYISTKSFPPQRYNRRSTSAIGATITPARRGWQLLLGVRVSPSGYPVFRGVTVDYRVAGHSEVVHQTFSTTFVTCVKRSQMIGPRCNEAENSPGG